ncbi:MAG: sulfatase-like hydrolase/transferase [Tolumonas sp.]|nr:sulfatase-like hydrolase/transferase [Tolumonas sp.]
MNFINLTLRQAVSYSRVQGFLSWNSGILFLLALLINISLGYELRALDAIGYFSFLCLLERLSRRAFKYMLIVSSLVAACYFPFGRTYGAPNFNSILSLYSSNPEEAGEILQVFPLWYYLVSLGILGFAALVLQSPARVFPRWSGHHSALLTVFLSISLVAPLNVFYTEGTFSLLNISYPVFHFVKDITLINMTVNSEHRRMQELATLQDNWHVVAAKPMHQVYVVVIGESARRDALGAFGGHWNNTPFMSHANGVLFQNYLSAASSTQQSLGLTLTLVGKDQQPQYQNNIVTLAKRAGFHTYWFSNQGQLGHYDTAIASIAKRADNVQFLKNGNFISQDTQDMDLLKFTNDALNQNSEAPKLIVYHLMGSHPKACERTHNKYETFVDNEEVSCYLYSITQTDNFLASLHQQLQNSGKNFSMIYFSDHGLAFKERGSKSEYLSHNDQFRQNYQVPMFITSSGDTRHRVVKAVRSANDFMSLFAEWSGIRSREVVPKYHFISEQLTSPAYVTNFTPSRIDYYKLPQDPFIPHSKILSQTALR